MNIKKVNKSIKFLLILMALSFLSCKKDDEAAPAPAPTPTPTGASALTFAGSVGVFGEVDATGIAASFGLNLNGITIAPDGTIFVADSANNCIRKITTAGVVSVYAGSTTGVSGSTEGIGTAARFNSPRGIVADASGNLWVADTGNCSIRKIPAGGLTTTSIFSGVSGTCAVGVVGAQAIARYNQPRAITIDIQGNLYVADSGNNVIRKIPTILATVGTSVAFAGTANTSGQADGATATFSTINGLVVDDSLNVYIVDSGNNTIRKATSGGFVTTFAGSAGNSGSDDGTSSAARFNNPTGITLSSAGKLYVTDSGNQTIRKITPAGVVTTIAGTVGTIGSTNSKGVASLFSTPSGIVAASSGKLYVTDKGNYVIREITP